MGFGSINRPIYNTGEKIESTHDWDVVRRYKLFLYEKDSKFPKFKILGFNRDQLFEVAHMLEEKENVEIKVDPILEVVKSEMVLEKPLVTNEETGEVYVY